jgi:hypothetical protein
VIDSSDSEVEGQITDRKIITPSKPDEDQDDDSFDNKKFEMCKSVDFSKRHKKNKKAKRKYSSKKSNGNNKKSGFRFMPMRNKTFISNEESGDSNLPVIQESVIPDEKLILTPRKPVI